jgi:hypothetical protein
VLTATDAGADAVDRAQSRIEDGRITVDIASANITFLSTEVGGRISLNGNRNELARTIAQNP